jgi:hypothetical protein
VIGNVRADRSAFGQCDKVCVAEDLSTGGPGAVDLFVDEDPYAKRLICAESGGVKDEMGEFCCQPGLSDVVQRELRNGDIDAEPRVGICCGLLRAGGQFMQV